MAMNTWAKNFGQSVKFSSVDVARELNPAITKLYDDNKEFMSSIATTLSDIYNGQTKITKALEGAAPDLSKSMNAGAGVWEVLKKDAKTFVKTGKVAGAGFEGAGSDDETFKEAGMEMDDGFDLNGDEFNFDDLPDPEDLMKGVDAEAAPSTEAVASAGAAEVAAINEGIKADVQIGAANVAAINKTTGAVGSQTKLVAEGFKNIANANYQLSASMILAQQSMAEKTKEQLKMINDNIANLISFNQDTNLKYAMAAMKYFDDSLEELKKISAGMERMSPTPKDKSDVESDYDKVFGGGFNLQSYWEVIKTNAQNTELGPLLGFLEQPDMLVEAFREPMSVLLKWGMTSLIPTVVKRATKELNRTVEEFIPAFFAKLSTMGEDYSTNPIFQFIGKLLGVNIGSSSLDLSNYEKGAVPFDGITHKSINQVIPTYLSQIVALLSGGEMRMFDHERGRFYTMSQIRRDEKMKDEQDRDYALGEGGRLLDKMKDDFAFETQEQEKAFAKYITDFKDAVVRSRKFIDWNKQEDLDDLFSQIHFEGVDPQTAAMMQQVLPDYFANYIRKNLTHSQQIRMANASNIAAMEKRRRLKNEDARGMAMSRYILSGNSDIELANDVDAFNKRAAQDTIDTVGNISSIINLNQTGAGNPPPLPPGSPSPQPNITGTSEGTARFSSTGANRRYGPDVRDYREDQEAKDKAAEGEVTYNKDYSKLIDQGMANLDDLIGGVEYATEKIAEFRRKQTAGATADLDDQGLPVTDDDDYEYEGEKEERERRKREEESFMDKVGRWVDRPTKLLTDAIETIDSTLYRVLFGASPDEESLLHVLVENIKSVFGRLKTFLHDEFYSPIKKFLFGDDFKKSNFYRFFSGAFEKGKSVFNGDFFTEVREQIKEDATDWKDDVTDYIAGSKFKGGRINEAGAYILSAGERIEHSGIEGHLSAGTDVIGSTGVYDLKAGDKVIPSDDMQRAAESEATFSFKMFERMHGGLSSKLDQVISAINNNTSVMSSDINAVQTAVEEGTTATKDVATKVVATSAAGDGKALPVDKEAVGKAKTPKEIVEKIESIKRLTGRQKKPFVDVILDKILNATGTFAAMFGGSKNLDNQHIQKEYMKDIRKKAPKVISRGLLGGGFLAAANLSGALTGAHGFGLLGSFFLPGGLFPALMLGMGVSMLHQSDRFMNMMYGRKIDGERQGGIIPKKVIDFFSKHKKHILAGGTIGLLSNLTGLPLTIPKLVLGAVIPGGGMLGGIALSTIGPVLIGSAAAVALHSDKFKRVLFGTGNPEDGKKQFGALNGQFMQRVKKALPNAVVGAGMGYLGMSTLGSIGILGSFMLPAWGGALLGGAIGVGMASEKFKEQMFGKMVNGKFVSGGLVDVMKNAVKAEILKPLSVFAQQSLAKTERFMALEIMMPIRKAMLPYKMLLEATFKKITTGLENFFKGVGNNVNRAFSPILSFLSKVIRTAWDWTWGASKKIINTVFSVAGTAISMPFKALSASGSFIGLFQNNENQAILKKAKEQNKALEEELKAKYDARLKELDEEEKKYKAERKAGRATGYEATEEQLALKTEQYQQEQEFIKQAQLQADKEAAIRREKAEVQREELKELVKTTNFKLEELSRENKRLLIELTGMTEEQLSAEDRIAELKVEEEIKAKPEKKASTITTLGATNITPASNITSSTAPKPLQSSQDKPKPISAATTAEVKVTEPTKSDAATTPPKPVPIKSTTTPISPIEAKSDKIVAATVETATEVKSIDRNVSNLVEVLSPVADSIIKEQAIAQETAKRSKAAKQPAVKTKPYVPKQGANATANAIKAAEKTASSTSSSSTTTNVYHAPTTQPSIAATQMSSIDSTLSETAQYEAQSLIKQDLMIQSLERLYQMLEFKFDDLLATNVEEVKESKKSNKSQLVKEVMSGAARQAGSKALDSIISTYGDRVIDWTKSKFEEHAKGFLEKVGHDVGQVIKDKLTALSTTSAGIVTKYVKDKLDDVQELTKKGFEAIYKKITGNDFDWSSINTGGGPGTGNEDHTSENVTELLTVVKTNFPLLIGKTNLIDLHLLAQTTKLDQLITATNDVAQAVRDIDFSGPTPPTSTGSPSGAHAAGGMIKKTGTYLLSEGEQVIRAGKGTEKDVAKSQDHEANFALKMFEKIYGTISEGIASLDKKFDKLIETTERTGDAIVESTEKVVDDSQVPQWAKDAFRTSQESIEKLESDAKETTLLRDSSRSVFGDLFGEKEEKEKKPEGLLRDSDKNVGQIFGGRTAQAIVAERKEDKFREDLLGSIRGLKFGQVKAEEKKESWFDKLKGLLGGLFGMLPDILKIGAILAALGAIKLSFSQQTHTDPDATDPYAENIANKERRIVARVAQRGARWAGRKILSATGHTFSHLAHHGLDTLSGANRAKGLGGPGFRDRLATGVRAGELKEEYLNKAIAHEERYNQLTKEIEQFKLTSTGKIGEADQLKKLEQEAANAKKFSDEMMKYASQMEARELSQGANSSIMDTLKGRNPEAQDAFTKIHDIGNKAINAVKNNATIANLFGPVGHRNFVGKLVELLGKITYDFVLKNIGKISLKLASAGIRIGGLLTGGVANVIFAGIDAFHGASNASTFFHVDPDKVDTAMIAISSIYSVLAGLPVIPGPIPINPLFVFDLIIDIVYGISGGSVDPKKHLFAMMYECIPFDDKQDIEQLQADSDKNFEEYKKQAGNANKTYLDYQHDKGKENTYIANAIREYVPGGTLLVGKNDEDGTFRHGIMSAVGEEWEQTKGAQVLNPMWMLRAGHRAMFGGKNEKGEKRKGLLSDTFVDRGIENIKAKLGIEEEPEIKELALPTFNSEEMLNTLQGKMVILRKMGLKASDYTKEEIAKWDPRSGKLPDLEDMNDLQRSVTDKFNAFKLSTESILRNFSTKDFLETFEGKMLLLSKMGIDAKTYTKEMVEKWDPRNGTLPDMTVMSETQTKARDALNAVQEKVAKATETLSNFDLTESLSGKKVLLAQLGIDASMYTEDQIKKWDVFSGYLPDMENGISDESYDRLGNLLNFKEKAKQLLSDIADADPLSTVEGKAAMLYQMGIDAESYTQEQLEQWDPTSGKLPDMKTALTGVQADIANKLTEYKRQVQELAQELGDSEPIKTVEGKMAILTSLGFNPAAYGKELIEKWDPTSGKLPDLTELSQEDREKIDKAREMFHRSLSLFDQMEADQVFTTLEGKRNLLYALGVDHTMYSEEEINAWDPHSGTLPDSQKLDDLQTRSFALIDARANQLKEYADYLENEERRDKQNASIFQKFYDKSSEALSGAYKYLFGASEEEKLPEGDELAKDRRGVIGKFLGSVAAFFVGEEDVGDYKGKDGILNRIVQGANEAYDKAFTWIFGNDESESNYEKAAVFRRALHDAIFFLVGGTHELTGEHKPFTESYLFEPMVKIRKSFNAVADWVTGGDENSEYGGKSVFRRAIETGLTSIGEGFKSAADAASKPLKAIATTAGDFFKYIFGGGLKEDISKATKSALEWITGGDKNGPYGGKFFLRRGLETGLEAIGKGFKSVADTISEPLSKVGKKANEAFQYIFGGQLKEDLKNAFTSSVEWITGGAMDSIYKGKSFLTRGFEQVETKAKEVGTEIMKDVSQFEDYVATGFAEVRDWFTGGDDSSKYGGKNFLERGFAIVENKASEISKKISDKATEFGNAVSETLSRLIDNITGFGKRSMQIISEQGLLKGGFNILANLLRGLMGLEWDPDPIQKAINAGTKAFKDAFGELGTIGNGIVKFFSGIATFVNKAIGLGPVKIVKMLADWALKDGAKADATSAQKNIGGFWDEVNKAVGGGGKEEIDTNPPPEYNAYEYVSSLMGGGADVGTNYEKSMYFSQKDPRWSSKSLVKGMDNYGNMSKLGCFPSVIAGATNAAYGRPVVKPDTVASMISKNDVAQNGSGTLPSFGPKAASAMGGTFNALDPNDTQSIDNALKRGYKVIGSKPGHYTLYDSHGTHDPLGESHDESVSAEKISKNAKAPGSPTTVGIITPRGMGLPKDVKSVPLAPGGVQQSSDLQKSLLRRRAEQVLAMRRRMLGGSGNEMRIEQQGPDDCTAFSTRALWRAYYGKDREGIYKSTWYSLLKNEMGITEDTHSNKDREGFEAALSKHFDAKPENPVLLYQTGGDGHGANPINRGTGNHATVIGRKLSDGRFEIYDPNGARVFPIKKEEVFDPTARGGTNNMTTEEGNSLFIPKIDPSEKIDKWQSSEKSASVGSSTDANKPTTSNDKTPSTNSTPSTAPTTTTGSGNFLSDLISGFAAGLSGGNVGSVTTPTSSSNTTTPSTTDSSGQAVVKDQMSEEEIWNWFKAKGYSPEVTAGIVGRLKAENGLSPKYSTFKKWNGTEVGGFGMFQWTYGDGKGYNYPDPMGKDKETIYKDPKLSDSRLVKYMKWVDANKGGNYESAGNELEYLWDQDFKDPLIASWSKRTDKIEGYPRAVPAMNSWYPNDYNATFKDVEGAADKWGQHYEVGIWSTKPKTYGEELYKKYKDLPVQTTQGTAEKSKQPTTGDIGYKLRDEAKWFVDHKVPYVMGGCSTSRIDCSGLVQYCCKKLGIKISRDADHQWIDFQNNGLVSKGSASEAKVGDIIWFKGSDGDDQYPGHVGIVDEGGYFLEAPGSGQVCKKSKISDRSDYMGYGDIRKYAEKKVTKVHDIKGRPLTSGGLNESAYDNGGGGKPKLTDNISFGEMPVLDTIDPILEADDIGGGGFGGIANYMSSGLYGGGGEEYLNLAPTQEAIGGGGKTIATATKAKYPSSKRKRKATNLISFHNIGVPGVDADADQDALKRAQDSHKHHSTYNLNIRKNGDVEYIASDDLDAYINHAGDYSDEAIGIQVAGTYYTDKDVAEKYTAQKNVTNAKPTDAQIDSMSQMVADLSAKYNIPIDRKHVIGHREAYLYPDIADKTLSPGAYKETIDADGYGHDPWNAGTDCPGYGLIDVLPTVVNKARQLKGLPPESGGDNGQPVLTGDDIIATGWQTFQGMKYVMGGTGADNSIDCSGFTQATFKLAGLTIPRTADEQYKAFKTKDAIVDLDKAQPGDLVFFENTYGNFGSGVATHVGIYKGNGKFIHASSGAGKVTESDINSSYYQSHKLGAGSIQKMFGITPGSGKEGRKLDGKNIPPITGSATPNANATNTLGSGTPAAGQSKFSIIGQALGAIIRGRMNTLLSGEDEIGKMIQNGEFNFNAAPAPSGTPTPTNTDGTTPAPSGSSDKPTTGEPSGSAEFKEEWTSLGKWDKLDAYATYMSDYAKAKYGVDVPTWWWRTIMREESGNGESRLAREWHNFGGMDYDPIMNEVDPSAHGERFHDGTSWHNGAVFASDKHGIQAEVEWFLNPKKGYRKWWEAEIAAAQANDLEKAIGLHINHYVFGKESGYGIADRPGYLTIAKEEFKRGANLRYGGGGGGLEYLLGYDGDIGGGGDFVYQNIPGYQGIPDNLIDGTETVSVQRAKYDVQLQELEDSPLPQQTPDIEEIQYDDNGNIKGLNIPEYNLIDTHNDSKIVIEAKKKAQLEQYRQQNGGSGDFVYQNIPGYQGIPDNIISYDDNISVQRAKYDAQLRYMESLPKKDDISSEDIPHDTLGNILGLAIPEYNIITPEDSIVVKEAKQEAQRAQLNGGGGKINYLAALFGDKEAQKAIGEAWSDALHPRKAKAKREAAEKKKKEAELKKTESVKRDFSKWKGGEYFNDVNAVHPMVHDYLKGKVSENELKKVVGVTDNETYLTAEQQQMLGFREYAKNVRNWNHFTTSAKLWTDGITPVEAWIQIHPEAQWKPEKKKDEKKKQKPDTAKDIADKKFEELKIEGETFIDEKDQSPTAKLARELKIRFDRFGNVVHRDKKYPDELKITEKDDNNTKYSKQAKQLAYLKQLQDAEDAEPEKRTETSEKPKKRKNKDSRTQTKEKKTKDKPKPQKEEKKPDTAKDIADKPEEVKIEGETFIDEKDESPTAKLARELKVRFDRFGNAVHSTEKYPDELKITEKDDEVTKYSKQAKQLAYIKELLDAKEDKESEKPEQDKKKKEADKPKVDKSDDDKTKDKPKPDKGTDDKGKKKDKPKASDKPIPAKDKTPTIPSKPDLDKHQDALILAIKSLDLHEQANSMVKYLELLATGKNTPKKEEEKSDKPKEEKETKPDSPESEKDKPKIEKETEPDKPKPEEKPKEDKPKIDEEQEESSEKGMEKKTGKPKTKTSKKKKDTAEDIADKKPEDEKKTSEKDTAKDIADKKPKEKKKKDRLDKDKGSTGQAPKVNEPESDVIVKRAGMPEDFGLDKLKVDQMNPELIKEVANRLHLEYDDVQNVKGLTKVPEYNIITKDDDMLVRYAKQRTQIVNFVEYGGKLPEVIDEEATKKARKKKKDKPKQEKEKPKQDTAKDIADKKPEELKIEGETFIDENDNSPVAKLSRELGIRFDRFGNAVHPDYQYSDELKITEKDDTNTKYSKQAKQIAYIKDLHDKEVEEEKEKPKLEEPEKKKETKKSTKTQKPKQEKRHEFDFYETNLGKLLQSFGIGPKHKKKKTKQPTAEDIVEKGEKKPQDEREEGKKLKKGKKSTGTAPKIKEVDTDVIVKRAGKPEDFGLDKLKADEMNPELIKEVANRLHLDFDDIGNVKGLTKVPEYNYISKDDDMLVRYAKQRTQIVNFVEYGGTLPEVVDEEATKKARKKKKDKPKPEKDKPKQETAKDIADKKPEELKIEGETFIDENDNSPIAKLSRELGIRFDRFGNAVHPNYQYSDELKITEKDDTNTKYSKQAKQIAYIKDLHDKEVAEIEKPKLEEPEKKKETKKSTKTQKPKQQKRHEFDFYETNLGKLLQGIGIGPKRKKANVPEEKISEDIVLEEKQKPIKIVSKQDTNQEPSEDKPKQQKRHEFDFYETNLGKLLQGIGIGPKRKKKKSRQATAEDIAEKKEKKPQEEKEEGKKLEKEKRSTGKAPKIDEVDTDVIVKRTGKPEDFALDKLKADEMNPELIKEVANKLHLEFDDIGNVKGLTKVPEYNYISKDDDMLVRYAKQRTQIVNFVEYGGTLPEVVDEEATKKAVKEKDKKAETTDKPEEKVKEKKKSDKDKPKLDPNFGLGESVVDEKDESPVAKMARELGLKFDGLGNIKDETVNIPKELVILTTDDESTKYTKQAKQVANYKKWKKDAEKKNTPTTNPAIPETEETKSAGTNKPEILAKTNPIESATSSSNVEYQSELISAIRSIDIRRQADMMVKYLEIIANGQSELAKAFSGKTQTPSGPSVKPPTTGMLDLSAGKGTPHGNQFPAFSPTTGAKRKIDAAGKLDYAAVHSKNMQIAMGGDFANA